MAQIKGFALFVNGKLLNDDGRYCKLKDQPAIALSKKAFNQDMIEEYDWDIVPVTITYKKEDIS